jgi:hypothetical protein
LKDLAEENPSEYVRHLRMSPEKFDELLVMIEPSVRKKDTAMRMAIPTRTKLEIILRYLASGIISFACHLGALIVSKYKY